MKVIDIINSNKPTLSFEVFPPKTSATFESVKAATEEISKNNPSFISVTCGAGGSTVGYTAEIAKNINFHGVPSVVHLTCVTAKKDEIRQKLTAYREMGIENILALRGDMPEGVTPDSLEYSHASDLVKDIKKDFGFCVGGACYPEGHPESEDLKTDIENLKYKVDAGCEFLTTQMFFGNDGFFRYLYMVRDAGINVPILPGIMPVTNAKQIKRICSLSNAHMPHKFLRIVDKFGSDDASMKQAGIIYAAEQIIDLYANGVNAVHLYTMNKPDIAKAIKDCLKGIVD